MIHLGRRAYPYLEETNEGIVREFRRLLPRAGRALDYGCGRGQLGEALQALGWEVWGIESSQEAATVAQKRLDRLIVADLSKRDEVRRAIGDARFEAAVFSDVLEHVYDPRTVLENALEFLIPGGRVFVSVPNAVVWTNRFNWLFGRVRYEDTGVMDRTHIRFFTFETARELVQAAGCTVERVASTPHLARAILPAVKGLLGKKASDNPRALAESRAYAAYMRYVYPAERSFAALWPGMLAFRIVVVGRKTELP